MTALLADWLPVCAAAVEGQALMDVGAEVIGVGKVAAAISLYELLRQRAVRGVLLVGVCGAYPPRHRAGQQLGIGDVAIVERDGFGDDGVATEQGFVDLAALRLPTLGPFVIDGGGAMAAAAARLRVPTVAATTVSTGSGTEVLSQLLALRTGAAVETMEGAAVAAVCARLGVPLLQLRAVSNWTGDRARAEWDLARAVAAAQRAARILLADP